MLTSSPSPTRHSITPSASSPSASPYSGRAHYEGAYRSNPLQPSAVRFRRPHALPSTASPPPQPSKVSKVDTSIAQLGTHVSQPKRADPPSSRMVDVGTQYSPSIPSLACADSVDSSTSRVANLKISRTEPKQSNAHDPSSHQMPVSEGQQGASTRAKRSTCDLTRVPQTEARPGSTRNTENSVQAEDESPSSKRQRPATPAVRLMPMQYEKCDTRDLVILIASMLMELVHYNDAIPLRDGHLTRFHSRAPPGISVLDYLQRLTTHATLSPPILLSMVYYIDKLCALYPAFTISSLTVHRFLITSATVASKGLSDSFWTNKTYARVGGVSVKELALLELEFLWRVEWRIVPKPEVLADYYRSLVERTEGYEIDTTGKLEEAAEKVESENG